jgi:3-carboxy-cis,cis-muconate cycloisomerase
MPGEHERAAGAWQAEAETLSELLRLTGSGAAAARSLLAELEVDPERMRANLELSDGLVMAEALATALGASLGRATAQELAQAASRLAVADRTSLAQAAAQMPEIVDALGQEGIAAALEPGAYLGVTEQLIERALAAHRERIGARG